jgi:hypothetical protein
VALDRDLDAVETRTERVSQRSAYPRSRAALAPRASDLEDLMHTGGGGDLLDDVGEGVAYDFGRDQTV